MGNRSHQNAGHRGMNALRKRGAAHASERGIVFDAPSRTVHAALTMDCVDLLRKLPDSSA